MNQAQEDKNRTFSILGRLMSLSRNGDQIKWWTAEARKAEEEGEGRVRGQRRKA
jgi:hypothetical protein